MLEFVKTETDGHVATVTFSRPPMNMINVPAFKELAHAIAELADNPAVRVVILTGKDRPPFGADPEVFYSLRGWDDVVALADLGHRTLWMIESMPKPVIFALHDGMCLGGAFELALSCHIRIGGTGLTFAHPETTVSMMPGWGNTQRLTRIAGPAKAAEIILTGHPISADEALRWGLLNQVVPNDRVLSEAHRIATAIAQKRGVCIDAVLAAIRQQWSPGLREGFAVELTQFKRTYEPDLLRRGLSAFLEGHPLVWESDQ